MTILLAGPAEAWEDFDEAPFLGAGHRLLRATGEAEAMDLALGEPGTDLAIVDIDRPAGAPWGGEDLARAILAVRRLPLLLRGRDAGPAVAALAKRLDHSGYLPRSTSPWVLLAACEGAFARARKPLGAPGDAERLRLAYEDAYLFLSRCGYTGSGEDFFASLARYLARLLDMDYVCIDRLDGESRRATTVAVWFDGRFEDNIEYELKDTPCGDVVGKAVCCFPARVRHLFPRDEVLRDMAAESYVGTTLWGYDGRPIGLIAIIGRKPLADPGFADSILRLVSVRAAGELERRLASEALERSRRLLEETGRMARVGGWEFDAATGKQAWTDEVYRIHGVGPDFEPTVEAGIGFYAPSSRSAIREAVRAAVEEGRPFDLELEFVAADGAAKWVHAVGQADPGGGRVRGTIQDITGRKLAELRVSGLLEERELLLREVHHRVKNNMAGVGSFLAIQAELSDDPATRTALEEAGTRVKSMELVYELLLRSPDFRSASTREYLGALFAALASTASREGRIAFIPDFAELRLDTDRVFPLGLILNELVTNALKYAFPGEARGTIRASLALGGDGLCLLSVADDGVGLPAAARQGPGTGFGLSLVKALTRQLGGSLSVESSSGTGTVARVEFSP